VADETLRRRVYDILEPREGENFLSLFFDHFMVILIVTNVIAIALESVQEIGAIYGAFFFWFELVSVAIFTVEYVLRVWSVTEAPRREFRNPVKGRLRFVMTPLAVIDLIAILPFYLAFLIPVDLRFLRVFRLLRLFKLTRYSPALASVGAVLAEQRRQLGAALVIMVTLLVFSASVAYILERDAQPEKFASIPDAMWWAMATLTTVGFGDVTPVTPGGKIFGSILMILGVGMYALPAGILATGFAREFSKREFTVTWRLVAKVPAFSKLDALTIAEIADTLIPKVVPPRYTVVRRGEPAEAMYFIASGEVEIDMVPHMETLSTGEFFGEIALFKKCPRLATVTTSTECQLLILEAGDFHRLVEKHENLKEQIEKVMNERLAVLEKLGHPV